MHIKRALSLAITLCSATHVLCCSVVIAADSISRPELLTGAEILDDFDGGVQNQRDGFRNAFFRSPSSAEARRVRPGFGGSKRCFQISGNREEDGFCGAWVQFFNMRSLEPQHFDAAGWSCLSFQVRGLRGGETFNIRLADRRWSRKEDALTIGPITEFLPGGVTTDWQEVVVPFSKACGLNLKQLAAISFELTRENRASRTRRGPKQTGNAVGQQIQIDHICVKQTIDGPISLPRQFVAEDSAIRKSYSMAMWIWSTAELIQNRNSCDKLFEVCRDDDIKTLWVQLPYSLSSGADHGRCQIENRKGLRQFISQASSMNIDVHSLDGFPEFALRQKHAIPLSVVDAIIDFNEAAKPNERFAGVHFDNEPYLLLGWHNGDRREKLLHDFLSLNVECQRRVRKAGIKFGIDVPFWWSMPDASRNGKASGSVLFNGVRKPASHHCIDLLDNVGIMNYRDSADGADGLIAHGQDLLRYSDSVDGADIYMGIETFRYRPQEVWFVLGMPQSEFVRTLSDRGQELARISRVNGLLLYQMQARGRVHVGVALDRNRSQQTLQSIRRVAACFGHWSDEDGITKLIIEAKNTTEECSEWQGFSAKSIHIPSLDITFNGFVTTRIMPSKVTFADNPFTEIARETSFAEEEFGQYKSYKGIAIHLWESYSKKRASL